MPSLRPVTVCSVIMDSLSLAVSDLQAAMGELQAHALGGPPLAPGALGPRGLPARLEDGLAAVGLAHAAAAFLARFDAESALAPVVVDGFRELLELCATAYRYSPSAARWRALPVFGRVLGHMAMAYGVMLPEADDQDPPFGRVLALLYEVIPDLRLSLQESGPAEEEEVVSSDG